jgi:hypothetical protein
MPVRNPNIIQKNDWLVLPRKLGLSFSITWREDDKRRQERYNLLEGFFSPAKNLQLVKPGQYEGYRSVNSYLLISFRARSCLGGEHIL